MTPEDALALARTVKETLDGKELAPSLIAIRGGEQVARVMLYGDTTRFLEGAAVAIPAFDAEVAMLIIESVRAMHAEFVAAFGREPRGGDARALFEAGRTDLVSECVSLTWVDRGGAAWHVDQPFTTNGKQIEWGEVGEIFTGADLQGYVPDTMRLIMRRVREVEPFAMTSTQRASIDSMAARTLSKAGFSTVLFAHDKGAADIYAAGADE